MFIQGIVLAALYIVSWFCGAIYFSAKSAEWRRLHKEHDTIERIDDVISFSNIANSIAATAVRSSNTILE